MFRTLRSLCEERSRICARHKIIRFFPSVTLFPATKKKGISSKKRIRIWAPSRGDGRRRCGARPRRRRGPRPRSTLCAMRARARASERPSVPRDVLTRTACFFILRKKSASTMWRVASPPAVARGEGGFESRVAGRGRVRGVDAVGEAEGGERLGDTTNGHTHGI